MSYETINPLALYDAMSQHQNTLNKQDAAFGMTQTNGWGGGAGILGAALGGLLAGKYGRDANQQQAEILKQQFLYEQEQHRLAQEAKVAADQEAQMKKFQALVPVIGEEKAQAVVYGGADINDLVQKPTELQRNMADPTTAAYLNKKAENSGVRVTNNMPTQGEIATEFQKKQAGKNAEKYNEWEAQAIGANETLANISKLKEISQLQNTGKAQEAAAMVGQWFNTDAASAMQQFGAVQKKMMLDAAARLKGAMSDGEWSVLQAQMPSFGNDPRANEVIMGILSSASERAIKRYQGATAHIEKNGKLQGFKPEFEFSASNRSLEEPKQEKQSTQTKTINGVEYYIDEDGDWATR